MATYIHKIFGKYMSNYKNMVRNRIGSLIRTSNTEILKIALDEMYKVLNIIDGRMVSQQDVPHPNRFPSSKHWNTFLEHLDIDLDKLYTANKIIIQDIQNVVNYNSQERENITRKLMATQSAVYQAYISSKKGISGTTIIREDFNTADSSNDAYNLTVDESVKRLSLKPISNVQDSEVINTNLVDASHYREQDGFNLYPNSLDLAKGSFWDIKGADNDHHFKNKKDSDYKDGLTISKTKSAREARQHAASFSLSGMVGGRRIIRSVGSCQFESVLTIDPDKLLHRRIERKISQSESIPVNDLMVNRPDSIWEKYISTKNDTSTIESLIKLQIPITDEAKLSTGMIIKIKPNDANNMPTIKDHLSYARVRIDSDSGITTSNKVAIESISPETTSQYGDDEGIYTITFEYPIVPSSLELVFSYGGDGWANIDYNVRIWKLQIFQDIDLEIKLEGQPSETETIYYKKDLFIAVDKEVPYYNAINNRDAGQELSRRDRVYKDSEGVK